MLPMTIPPVVAPEIIAFYTALPTEDYECFRSVENGDFSGYTPVTPEFYEPIIAAILAAAGKPGAIRA